MLQIGSLLDNKYKILSEVGHGGMSVVYLAINERANKTWAVKEIRKDGVVDFESVRQGLVVETDMLKRFNHPNLPSIIDVIDSDDSFIIVMDYVEGVSLLDLLKKERAQSEEKVVRWGRQLCDVLGYLHRQSPPIIYRDMKPANVMLKPDGNITLIDFGIAREFKDRAMVEDTTCLGTRGYAAPEQFGGRGQTDPRTDIYCLGATLYHLITGHSPAEPPYEIKPLSYWIPQYAGSGLEKVIMKCTQQDPAARYQNCAELMYALEHYKEEDEVVRKQRKKIWNRFLIWLIVGGIGLGGMVGFFQAKEQTKKETYDGRIAEANSEEKFDDAYGIIKEAIQLDPERPEAYLKLIEKAQYDLQNNASGETALSSDVQNKMKSCLINTENINRLRATNPEEYAKAMYKMGLLYFFSKGGVEQIKNSNSGLYFDKLFDAENEEDNLVNKLHTTEKEIASELHEICGYIGNLDQASKGILDAVNYDDETKGSYEKLFNDLKNLAGYDLNETSVDSYMAIRIYHLLTEFLINEQDIENFRKSDIGYDEIKKVLETIETNLNTIKGNIKNEDSLEAQQYKETLDMVTQGKSELDKKIKQETIGGNAKSESKASEKGKE